MRTPYFITLAQVDRERFVAACRHGLVHLTWGRVTLRFLQDEFRRLVRLVEKVLPESGPLAFRDRELCLTYRPHEDSEIQLGPLVLLLPHEEYLRFAQTIRDASRQLDEVLASGAWKEEAEPTRPDWIELLRRIPFSTN